MNDKFRYPEQRTPSVTPSRALWLLFVVAIAAGAWLMLSLAGTGTRPDRLIAGDTTAEERHAVLLPATPVPVAAPPGTSVPEASTIFNGSDGMPVEETAQTF
jgi:hypothetical protein